MPDAPKAERRPLTKTLHGIAREDPYAWLADREDPAVRAYLEAENAYADALLEPTRSKQDELYRELVARIKEDDESVPVREGPFLYYARSEKGKDYSIHCRRPVDGGDEHVYLDENVLAQGQAYFHCADFDIEDGHRLLAYTVDVTGDERYDMRFLDLETGEALEDTLTDIGGSVVWALDRRTVFYSRLDAAHRPHEIWRHTLGDPPESDVRVHHDPDERFFLGFGLSRDRRFIVLASQSQVTSEWLVIPADKPAEPPRIVAPRRQGIEYSLAHHGDRFFIRTNEDAVNFKVVTAPDDNAGPENWQPFMPHDEAVMIRGVDAFAGHLVVSRRVEGRPELLVIDLESDARHVIDMPEPAYGVWVSSNPTFDTTTLRFVYSSMLTPRSVFDYDMATRTRELRKQDEVKGYDKERFVAERVWADAPDGKKVPISVLRRKDGERGGRAFLSGYGAYGAINDPTFSSIRLSLAERGIAVAVAHVRGGSDLGRPWYDNGKLQHKKNTFTDFIACAERLIAVGHASDGLAIYGGSAGGLLVGAAVNARPDLFTAVVADVPFVDVINTMLDASLPLTVGEWEEWGNPAEPEAYKYIASYAPYENIERQDYPAMLVLAGWSDPRVGYWEPAKFVARLRERKTDANPLLLVTHLDAGHGGPSGRYPALREWALVYTFVLEQLGG